MVPLKTDKSHKTKFNCLLNILEVIFTPNPAIKKIYIFILNEKFMC